MGVRRGSRPSRRIGGGAVHSPEEEEGGWRRVTTRGGIRARMKARGSRKRILIIRGNRVMIRRGRTRCRGLSRPNTSATALRVSRQATAEAEGRSGCRTMLLGLESSFHSSSIFQYLIFALLRQYDGGMYKNGVIRIQSELHLVEIQ